MTGKADLAEVFRESLELCLERAASQTAPALADGMILTERQGFLGIGAGQTLGGIQLGAVRPFKIFRISEVRSAHQRYTLVRYFRLLRKINLHASDEGINAQCCLASRAYRIGNKSGTGHGVAAGKNTFFRCLSQNIRADPIGRDCPVPFSCRQRLLSCCFRLFLREHIRTES